MVLAAIDQALEEGGGGRVTVQPFVGLRQEEVGLQVAGPEGGRFLQDGNGLLVAGQEDELASGLQELGEPGAVVREGGGVQQEEKTDGVPFPTSFHV